MVSMTIVNEIKNHGYITCLLNIVVLTKHKEKIRLFIFHLTLTLFPKNIQSNFTLRLVCKKSKITIATMNCTSQFKLKYR